MDSTTDVKDVKKMAITDLKNNLKELKQLHLKLRYILKELEELIKE